jgi:hypothetical protein
MRVGFRCTRSCARPAHAIDSAASGTDLPGPTRNRLAQQLDFQYVTHSNIDAAMPNVGAVAAAV